MLLANLFFALSVAIQNAGDRLLMPDSKYFGMSGISRIAADTYAVVRDKASSGGGGCRMHLFTIKCDDRGSVNSLPGLIKTIRLKSSRDVEGIAYDSLCGTIWASDEADTSIREYDMTTGERTGRMVMLPEMIKKNCTPNFSLEALTISPNAKTLWTCNEEALVCDGLPSLPIKGTTIRIMKYSRDNANDDWKPVASYAYECDAVGGLVPVCSGVAALCAIDDDTLLVLERECSLSTFGRTRIYAPSFSKATDVTKIESLSKGMYTPAEKGKVLYEVCDGAGDFTLNGSSSVACYEGLCLGEKLADGSCGLLMVSDGGAAKNIPLNKKINVSVKTRSFMRSLRMGIISPK